MIQDLDQVERGGTFVRFIVGRYGSGKTFFLHLLKNVALQRKFVVLEADITTDRRLHGSGGTLNGYALNRTNRYVLSRTSRRHGLSG